MGRGVSLSIPRPCDLLRVSRDPNAREASILYNPMICVLATSVLIPNELESLEGREPPF